MSQGVKAGTRRGSYNRFNKPRLRKLARDILAGKIDPEAVAQAFQSTGQLPDFRIACQLREGQEFNPQRLAQAVEALGAPRKPIRRPKQLPLWMVKGALRHLAPESGGKGEPIHEALGVGYPYVEHTRVKAYHRQLRKDHGARTKAAIEQRLNELWPQRKPGQFPELERVARNSISGEGVPLELWRSVRRKEP